MFQTQSSFDIVTCRQVGESQETDLEGELLVVPHSVQLRLPWSRADLHRGPSNDSRRLLLQNYQEAKDWHHVLSSNPP